MTNAPELKSSNKKKSLGLFIIPKDLTNALKSDGSFVRTMDSFNNHELERMSEFFSIYKDNITWKTDSTVDIIEKGEPSEYLVDTGYIDGIPVAIRFDSDDMTNQNEFDRIVILGGMDDILSKEIELNIKNKNSENVLSLLRLKDYDTSSKLFYEYYQTLNDKEKQHLNDGELSEIAEYEKHKV